MQLPGKIFFPLLVSIALFASGCGGGSGSSGGGGTTPPPPPSTANEWTWMSGSDTTGASGVYGTLGVASASNVPGGRYQSVSWKDSSGNFWLFSGSVDAGGTSNPNDLWEFNPSTGEWAFMGGSTGACVQIGVTTCAYGWPGVYGTEGVASAGNVPGGREMAVSWTDSSGNFWLFGGIGYDSTPLTPFGRLGDLNDLWEFSPATKEWTWMSGSSKLVEEDSYGDYGQIGVYGTLGVAGASNVPGGRYGSVSWLDQSGNLWLFGGYGYASTSTEGNLNDLWKFSPATKEWTWVSGSDSVNATGVYGSLGMASTNNVPGSRYESVSWVDTSANLWLFGGSGFVGAGVGNGQFNDLWEFDPTTKEWTWVSGSNTANASAVYGTLGTGSTNNTPGARSGAVSWTDSSGGFWLFGGDSPNDLWKFNSTAKTWTWENGSSTSGAATYGTEGVAAASNVPGARGGSVSWVDSSGNLWLFGGAGNDSTGTNGDLNDLWRYQP